MEDLNRIQLQAQIERLSSLFNSLSLNQSLIPQASVILAMKAPNISNSIDYIKSTLLNLIEQLREIPSIISLDLHIDGFVAGMALLDEKHRKLLQVAQFDKINLQLEGIENGLAREAMMGKHLNEVMPEPSPEVVLELSHQAQQCIFLLDMLYMHVSSQKLKLSKLSGEQLLSEITEMHDRVSKTEKDVQQKSTDIGLLPTKQQIDNYAKIFKEEARKYKEESQTWITRTFWCIISIALFAVANYLIQVFAPGSQDSVNMLIQSNLTRILILTCMFYALTLCVRNYKSCRHNEIVNKHRENAISSFEAFVANSSTDAATRDSILLEVTRTIFSNQPSGFIDTTKDESAGNIVEIFKGANMKS